MSARQRVSVVMCFLDSERFIEDAIESVFAQEHDDWELVLVDDGSSDRSSDIARRYARNRPDRVRYVEHPGHVNRGKSASRNAGIAAGRSAYVLFLDSDDVLLPHALGALVAALDAQPDAGVAYARTLMWFSWPGNPDGRPAAWDFASELPAQHGTCLPAGALLHVLAREDDVLPSVCSAMVRRHALEDVGGWEPSFTDVYDDFVLWTKLFARHPVVVVDDVLSRYRKHDDSSCEQATRTGEWSAVDLSAAQYRYLAWMERWLTENRLGDRETWTSLEAALEPYRHPKAPVVVEHVQRVEGDGVHAHLDHPASGQRTRSHRVPISGWAAAAVGRAVAVEVRVDGRRVSHVPIDERRPDVAAALPVDVGEVHGFTTALPVSGLRRHELEVTAVLDDQRRVPLAHVATRRLVRRADEELGSTSVSAIIVCRTEAGGLVAAIEHALAQDHRPLEVVVVDDGSSSALEQIALSYPGVRYVRRHGEGPAAARTAGLHRSTGDVVVFLSAQDRLAPRAASTAAHRLAERPECGFVASATVERPLDVPSLLHDGAPGGPVAYRRLALAAAGGIRETPAGLEDELQQLAVARHMPGMVVAEPFLASPRPAVRVAPEVALTALRAELGSEKDRRTRHGLAAAERRLAAATPRRRRRRHGAGDVRGRCLVLLYHRIAELDADPWSLGVSRAKLAEQLAVLRVEATPMPLDEVVGRIGRGGLPERAVAVTFDDGYRDNLTEAVPELQAAGVPATFFVTGGDQPQTREMWWDELERVLLSPGSLPEHLALRVAGIPFTRELGEDAQYDEDAAAAHAGWRVGQRPPTARHEAYAALWHALFPLSAEAREPVLDTLGAWSGDSGGIRPTHEVLQGSNLAALASSPGATIGGHTVTHPRLSRQPPSVQVAEIAGGRATLQELTGQPVRHFAYPFGGLRDYSGATTRIVAEAGYTSACATWDGLVHGASDPFQLPRVQVDDVDGKIFATQLASWFER